MELSCFRFSTERPENLTAARAQLKVGEVRSSGFNRLSCRLTERVELKHWIGKYPDRLKAWTPNKLSPFFSPGLIDHRPWVMVWGGS